jgi:hypothetical protein
MVTVCIEISGNLAVPVRSYPTVHVASIRHCTLFDMMYDICDIMPESRNSGARAEVHC